MTSFAMEIAMKYCQALKYSDDWSAAKNLLFMKCLVYTSCRAITDLNELQYRLLLYKRQRKQLVLPVPLFQYSSTNMGLENQGPSFGLSDWLTWGICVRRKGFAMQASYLPCNSLDYLTRFCLSSPATGAILI